MSNLPAMYQKPSGMSDMATPMILLQAELSELAKQRLTDPGDVVYALSTSDPGFETLIKEGGEPSHFDGYIVQASRTMIHQPPGGDRTVLPDNYQRADDERDVWPEWTYYIYIPELVIPGRLTLKRTAGARAFRKINYLLALEGKEAADAKRAPKPLHLRFSTAQTTGRNGKPFKFFNIVRIADDDGLAQAIEYMNAGLGVQDENAAPVADGPEF